MNCKCFTWVSFVFTLISTLGMVVFPSLSQAGQGKVVVYTALDQVFSEPILNEFEKKSGIKVKAVYDVEAVKTTGLVNRLIAEHNNPQCDVFWNNEILRTIFLKKKNILTAYQSPSAKDIPQQYVDKDGYWHGFAARARVIIANTDLVKKQSVPTSIFDLTSEKWNAKAALANPLFGTTATHVAALFAHLGTAEAEKYFRELRDNQVRIVDGNSVVKDQVGAGELLAGLTDTDDANMGKVNGLPLETIYPDQNGMGTLLIPNTVGLIAGGPNPDQARQLIDYLLSEKVEEKLSFSHSVQMPLRSSVKTPDNFVSIDQIKAMPVDYEKVAEIMNASVKIVQDLFIK